jgi:hypothetical protein
MQREPETSHERQAYANFVFPKREQAHDFTGMINELDWQVEIEFAADRGCWRVRVERKILTFHQFVAVWLATLTARAATVGGDYDGWGVIKNDAS